MTAKVKRVHGQKPRRGQERATFTLIERHGDLFSIRLIYHHRDISHGFGVSYSCSKSHILLYPTPSTPSLWSRTPTSSAVPSTFNSIHDVDINTTFNQSPMSLVNS